MTATRGLVALCLTLAIVKYQPALGNRINNIEEQKIEVDYRLPRDIEPLYYTISLVPYFESEDDAFFDGKVSIGVKIRKATSKLVLHSKNLTINEEATVITFGNKVIIPRNHSYDTERDFLILSFENILSPEIYTLTIEFQGSLLNSYTGFYKNYYYENEENKKHWFAATNFRKDSARLAFPCWDEPGIRTPFSISVKHDPKFKVLSNSNVSYVTDIDPEDGRIWKHFQSTPFISIYMVAVVIGDFEQYSNEEGSVNFWVRKGQKLERVEEAIKMISRIDKEYQSIFKHTIQPPTINHVVLPHYIGNDHFYQSSQWGLMLYRETPILPDIKEYGRYRKLWRLQVIANGLAQQWYGNFFSIGSWDYEWLQHALTNYYENYVVDKILTEWGRLDEIRSFRMSHNLQGGTSVKAPVSIVLSMIWNTISKEIYEKGLLIFLQRNKMNSVTPDHFWDALQDALDSSGAPFGNFDIKDFANSWMKQKCYPEITVSRSHESGNTKKLHITQQFYRRIPFYEDPVDENSEEFTKLEKEDKQLWTVPITITSRSKQNFISTIPTIWINQRNTTVYTNDILPNDWLIINLKRTGYYRVNYDNDNWMKIAKYMNTKDYVNVNTINRAQLIDDAFDLFIRNKMEPVAFFELFNYLGRETSYIVWENVFEHFTDLRDLINIPEWAKIFKSYTARLMNNLLHTVGYEERPNENALTSFERWTVLKMACFFGHPECKVTAQQHLIEFLRDSKIENIDLLTDKERWMLCYGLNKADKIIWNKVYDLYLKNPKCFFLDFLSCSENQTIIEDYLRMMISKDSAIVKNNHTVVAFSDLCYIKNIDTDIILNFLERNWKNLLSYFDDPNDIFKPLISNIYQRNQLKKLEKILETANIGDPLKVIAQSEKFLEKAQQFYTKFPNWVKSGRFEDPEKSNTIL
ncbi:aminopeptidase N-like [Prorops nasuta]|uniref:aminopeptidase N-like n=1 Tax=Prorops nasuta TaxID=863751 RepID=UPI0034CF4020